MRKFISKYAIKLRRLPVLHRAVRWFRRVLIRAVHEAAIEFGRWLWRNNEQFGPPLETFSVYQSLRTGEPRFNGKIILHDQGCPRVEPQMMMVTGGYRQHREQPWPIFWSEHQNARLVTSSLAMLGEGKKTCIESVYGFQRLRDDPAYCFFRLPAPVHLKGRWTSVISRWVPTGSAHLMMSMPNYTHWLLDALPRLALLPSLPTDTKILVPADLHANQWESLALLGLKDRCRPTAEQHLTVEQYFFSSPTAMLQCYNPYGIAFLRDSFLPKREKGFATPKRFFIRRVGLSREPANAEALEKFFEARGWTPINVIKLSFAQQVQLFHEADEIAGMFGSGFTNSVFCRPGCRVFPIMPEEFGLDGFLDWISQVVGFQWFPLVVKAGYDFQYNVDLEAVERWLAPHGCAGNV